MKYDDADCNEQLLRLYDIEIHNVVQNTGIEKLTRNSFVAHTTSGKACLEPGQQKQDK